MPLSGSSVVVLSHPFRCPKTDDVPTLQKATSYAAAGLVLDPLLHASG